MSLTFFDWDDTFLCSTFLDEKKISCTDDETLSDNLRCVLKLTSQIIEKIIIKAKEKGPVYIVTNSSETWIDISTKKYYPSLVDLINNTTHISAQTLYSMEYPFNPFFWKFRTFETCLLKESSKLYQNNIGFSFDDFWDFNKTKHMLNIISIGDAMWERDAIFTLSRKYLDRVSHTKSIKMAGTPSPLHILYELKLLYEKMDEIYDVNTDLDLMLTIVPLLNENTIYSTLVESIDEKKFEDDKTIFEIITKTIDSGIKNVLASTLFDKDVKETNVTV